MDRISNYRQARLTLNLPPLSNPTAGWHLLLIGVRKGIPTSHIVVDGRVPFTPEDQSVEAIILALDAAVRQMAI